MQGDRASLGSLPEALNFEHGSTSTSSNVVMDQQICWKNIPNHSDSELQNYMISAADTHTAPPNSFYHEQHNLHRFVLGEASSSGTKNKTTSHNEQSVDIRQFEERRNDKLELNPLFVQPPSGNCTFRNVNLNAEYNEHLEDMNLVTGQHGFFEVYGVGPRFSTENSVRPGSSINEHRVSCKRKAHDASIGQCSSERDLRKFQRGESSSWISAPAYNNPTMAATDLNLSLDHCPRGLVSCPIPKLPAPAITESSSINYSVSVNPTDRQEIVSPSVISAGSVIRRPFVPSLNLPRLLPADQQVIDLRYGHALGNFASQDPNDPATHMRPVSRNIFNWSGNPLAAVVSSSFATPVDRNVIHRDETRQRSSILEIPVYIPAPELRNGAHGHISRNASTAIHVASSSRTTAQPSPANPELNPYQNNVPHNQRRLSERRLLLSSLATNQRAARSLVTTASPDEPVLQSGGDNTSQVQNEANPELNPYQNNVPHNQRRLCERRSLLSSLATSQRAARSLVTTASPDEPVLQSGGDSTSQVQNEANPELIPYQNNVPHNQSRLSERRSLLSSLAINQRAARSLVATASPVEHVLQSGGDNTSQVQNEAYLRAGQRQGQNAIGTPHSLRGLASTSRGRSRIGASEIRIVLEHMRRGGNLRFEDVMLLNQSMMVGVADINDRYRDMRLDVDNMTYEELLSLEERIGNVCTGLNEETISNKLKQQKYKTSTRSPKEEEPCSICQEEYKEGEEIGILECEHDFHSQCIKEWLKQKNLCPICRTTGLNTADKQRRQ